MVKNNTKKLDKTQIIVAIIVALSSIIVGYWQFNKKPETSKPVGYIGRVTDAKSGFPVRGAKISFDFKDIPPIVYTDSEGIYRFSVIIKGDKIVSRVRVEADGYISYDRNIVLLSDVSTIEDIRLNPKNFQTTHQKTEFENKTESDVVRAKGIGFSPPNMSNSAQRFFAKKRAAEADAMQKLAKSIKGAIVKSKTEITNGKFSKDKIEIYVNAVLKSARVVSEKELDDGSYEVVMEAPLSQ
ncbi:MAG: hypothetical protein GY749_16505 [Desulfobacteraceae bacterium]|nr:hypothetical protein [Desulfobacteraceae bacterium]